MMVYLYAVRSSYKRKEQEIKETALYFVEIKNVEYNHTSNGN